MCDKGLLEIDPTFCKLEYCITISRELQDKLLGGIKDLVGEEVVFETPLPGNTPQENYSENGIDIILKNKVKSKSGKFEYDVHVCRFYLKELPGCCGILVSYNMIVFNQFRNKGIASFLQVIKEDIAKENRFSTLMCTTIKTNELENSLLEKTGWSRINMFNNARTSHDVIIWTKNI